MIVDMVMVVMILQEMMWQMRDVMKNFAKFPERNRMVGFLLAVTEFVYTCGWLNLIVDHPRRRVLFVKTVVMNIPSPVC